MKKDRNMRNFEDLQIAVAGTGYVGLSIATLLSQHHKVTAVDVIPEKVEKINNRISPIQDEYIEKYFAEKELNLTATLDGASAYKDADFVVIAAPTNYDPAKNFFDTHHIEDVIDLVLSVNPEATMVIKSTIPVGYCRSLYVKYAQKFAQMVPLPDGKRREFRLLFSPEFLRESKALEDNLYPSRIIVGYPKMMSAEWEEENEAIRKIQGNHMKESAEIFAKQGTVVDTVVSGENGRGVSGELHMGKYIVKEKCAPTGYLLNPEPREVELDYKDQNTRVVYGNVTIADMPARGKVVITKTDSESGTFLAGAEFAITAADDIITPDGTVRAEKGTVVDTVITNDEGKAYSKELFLGSYTVTEIKQPEGYVRSDQTWDVELLYEDQNTSVVTETVDAQNVPTRFVLTKKEAGSEEHLQGVKFEFWEKAGSEESEKEIVTTGEDGTLMIEKIMPGTYCIQEIETVPGYMLNETIYEFTVTDDGRIDGEETGFMTVENEKTKITCTKAVNAETGGQELLPKESRATDTVSMENLQSGTEYMLRGVLVDWETGKPLRENDSPSGAVLMSEYRFTATDSQMDVDMEFVFDAAAFAGRTIVVFEYLYQEDVEISRHADLEDLMQQLYVKDAEQQTGEKKEMDTPKETPQTGDEGSVLPIAAVAGAGTAAVLSVAMRVRYKKDCRENER